MEKNRDQELTQVTGELTNLERARNRDKVILQAGEILNMYLYRNQIKIDKFLNTDLEEKASKVIVAWDDLRQNIVDLYPDRTGYCGELNPAK
jgi:hypothetical protein